MEVANTVHSTESSNAVEPGRLTKALITTVQIIVSLVMFIIVLPYFILWRVAISFLYLTKKEKEESRNSGQKKEREDTKKDEQEKIDEDESKPPPPKDAHERALDIFNPRWKKFRDRPINKPLVAYWSRIACCLLLVTQTILSLALLEKSLVYHIPWFIAHLSNTQYKTTKKKLWQNDLLLHLAGLIITCAPFVGVIGVGVGIMYYMVKVYKYGKFQKGAVKKKGGRGYDNPMEKKTDEREKGRRVEEAVMGAVNHVMHLHPHPHPHLHLPHLRLPSHQLEYSPHGYPGYSEDILFEQPGDELYGYHDAVQPPPVVIQSPKRTAWYDKNPYTLAGIASIWTGKAEKMNTGYDGREVRRRNFEDDIEMADRV